MTTPEHVSPTPSVGVREAWLYTWGGLVLYALVLYGLAVTVTVARTDRPGPWLWGLLLTYTLAFLGLTLFCRNLKAGLWSRTTTTSQLAALLIPAVGTSVLSWQDPDWVIAGQIPWFIACSTWAFAAHRKATWPLILLGALGSAGGVGVGIGLNPASGQYMLDHVLPVMTATWFMTSLTPLMVWLTVWWWGVILKLESARKTQAELAVARERLRFASDLHDIQGHHLQVIALKAELAQRLLDRDLEASRTQLQDVRSESQTALQETRALVQGLRQVSLEQELANAAEVLTSAGITSTHHVDGAPSSSTVRHTLGLVAREATTNILRHARATTADYQLACGTQGTWTLTISNDGAPPPGHETSPTFGPGTGLEGLRERLHAVGGNLSVEHADNTFTVSAVVPDDMTHQKHSNSAQRQESSAS